ncbi:unnamed protein product [Blepharisma stoltei]|uniref:2-oxoglutarate dehydrogenase, mitochondrial n=1 Tax=Blepharisma stoltei TaxID=1481888 RepID=A0AAU9ILY4_9CILI|nr:unnamed protein product [Blepharisma stoltei]
MFTQNTLRFMKYSKRLFGSSVNPAVSSSYFEALFDLWKSDKNSLPLQWKSYFENLDSEEIPVPTASVIKDNLLSATDSKEIHKVLLLYRAYQLYGYMLSDVDPLKLTINIEHHLAKTRIPGLIRWENFKFTDTDMEKSYDLGSNLIKGFIDETGPKKGVWKLKDLIENCKRVYCGKIGFEYMHIPYRDECNWMRMHIEKDQLFAYSAAEKVEIFQKLARTQLLEEFFHKKFSSHKRFGMDGLETAVLAVEGVIENAVSYGYDNFIIGMPHRGRLNIMANALNCDLKYILSLFFETQGKDYEEGDVKYHLGHCVKRTVKGKEVTIRLMGNPSHLEAVDPVAVGQTKALLNERKKALCILIHGDAALAGQGVVYETVQMEDLTNYKTGGTIHLVLNNNIGFTTVPREARTGLFPTEIAKVIGAPILHVNADCPEEIDFASRLAVDWKEEFKNSIFLDIIGYRRFGHNELDEPLFTNPKMYQLIAKHPTVLEIYSEKLKEEGVLNDEEISNIKQSINDGYNSAFENAQKVGTTEGAKKSYFENLIGISTECFKPTGVKVERLKEIGIKCSSLPESINAHPGVKKLYKNRLASIEKGQDIDWPTAEALAWGSILTIEKYPVRLSGQDVERGTFSQRHAIIQDQKIDLQKYIPLRHIDDSQSLFYAINSHLSEYAALGFEYGYSLNNPNALVMWEAQFGDFANGAQIVIDQFISSGEVKWGQPSGLVLLLPHGYDGQGSEHSNARLERFLQLSMEDPYHYPKDELEKKIKILMQNLQIVYPSTPANYFHFLRRQVVNVYRKPLIVMTSKKLLRYKGANSNLNEFSEDFPKIVYDDNPSEIDAPENIKKVILCTGQVYYDLVSERSKRNIKDIAIIRLEQLAPFPFDEIREINEKYHEAELQWVQEEPLNYGAWSYVSPRILTILGLNSTDLSVVSRKPSGAVATGYHYIHVQEVKDLLDKAMTISS